MICTQKISVWAPTTKNRPTFIDYNKQTELLLKFLVRLVEDEVQKFSKEASRCAYLRWWGDRGNARCGSFAHLSRRDPPDQLVFCIRNPSRRGNPVPINRPAPGFSCPRILINPKETRRAERDRKLHAIFPPQLDTKAVYETIVEWFRDLFDYATAKK